MKGSFGIAFAAALVLCAGFSSCASPPPARDALYTQNVIEQPLEELARGLPAGTRVAVVAFDPEGDEQQLAEFIIEELSAALERFRISAAERRSIRIVFREHDGRLLDGAAGEIQTAELILLVIPDNVAAAEDAPAAPLLMQPVIPEVIAQDVAEAPVEVIPPDAELIPRSRNWLSGEFTWLGAGIRYDRNITDWFSVGVNIFLHRLFGYEHALGIDWAATYDEYASGTLATARFFPWGFPFYLELGMGWGGWHSPDRGRRSTGPMLDIALGLRLGGHRGGFFVNPFASVATVFCFANDYDYTDNILRFGAGFGWAW